MNKVKCPHCGKVIEISEAVKHELEETILKEEREKQKILLEKEKIAAIEKAEAKLNIEINKKLELADKEKKILEEKLEKEEKTKEEFEKKALEKAEKEASERHRLDKMAWEKQKADMQKAIEEAQRKGKQGSQQLQGEVLELDLEDKLREAFPLDDIKPVPKGITGADIVQEIKNKFGNIAGSIVWETKRTKTWDKGWLQKLKDDMRKINGSECILVSNVLPPNLETYDRVESVWVCSYEHAIKLAEVLRYGLLNTAIARSSASHSDEQLKELYDIVTSDRFRQMFEARDEIISVMKKELDAEKASAERRWKRQEVYIEKLSRNNTQLYGELEAHVPSLKPLNSFPQLEQGDEIEE
jgi:hypothetical protein